MKIAARGEALRLGVLVLVLAGFTLAGIVLRLGDLGDRPLHADEATGARLVADRLEKSDYQFDPTHYHGPMLTAAAAVWSGWWNQNDWRSLEVGTLRQVVGWSGVGVVMLAGGLVGFGWRRLVAMALVSTSPFLVYYSRMFIHEPLLVFFSSIALLGLVIASSCKAWRAWAALLVGVGVGGMAVTRETFVVSLLAWSAAGTLWIWRSGGLNEKDLKANSRLWAFPAVGAIFLSAAMVFWFYSSGGSHPAGVIDFFRTYLVYETGAGHGKPWFYYLEMLAWPKHQAGGWWSEGGLLLIALTLYWPGCGKNPLSRRLRFFLEAGLMHLAIFSLLSYKTPWLAMLGWFHICLAAAGALTLWLVHLTSRRIFPFLITGGVLLSLLVFQYQQASLAVGRLATDSRNPYAYVPTSRDVASIAPLIRDLQVIGEGADVVPVVGTQYWPLPWYLRECGTVGYWPEWEDELQQWPILILLPTSPEAASAIESSHVLLPKGLRHEFPVTIAVEQSLWNRYLEDPEL